VDAYEKILNHYGQESQILKTIEELGELTTALSRSLNGREDIDNIAEEIADVEIMLEQMKRCYKIISLVNTRKGQKLNRVENRIREAKFKG
jgi:NTP pyrophosphatase (non-canonical NTP hydrolase)